MSGAVDSGLAMPTHSGDLSVEARGMEPIPTTNRYGSALRIFTVWFAPNLVPPAFFLGTLAAADFLQLGFMSGLLAIILGNLIGSAVVGSARSPWGPRPGWLSCPYARLPFGKSIVLPAGINFLACIAWDAFDSIFGAAAISLLTGLPFVFGLAIIIVAQAVIGITGYEAIHTFQKWMSVVLAALFVAITIGVFNVGSTSATDGFTGADQLGAFVTMTTIVASFVLAWGVYASDYSRYLPPQTSSSALFFATVAGLTLSGRVARDPGPLGLGNHHGERCPEHPGRCARWRCHRCPGDGRDGPRHRLGQRHERLHRVAVPSGGGREHSPGRCRPRSSPPPRSS